MDLIYITRGLAWSDTTGCGMIQSQAGVDTVMNSLCHMNQFRNKAYAVWNSLIEK
jgi:pentatricopeptide repeat protein